jgi:hypothetical protein
MVFGPSPSGPSLGHGSLPSGSLVRLRELGREQRALFASMPMDVQVSLTALNETFVSEYGEHETVGARPVPHGRSVGHR